MSKLEKTKEVIKEYAESAACGIFDCRNMVGDPMATIYEDDEITIDICYDYEYFEVFGLSDEEFEELYHFYAELVDY